MKRARVPGGGRVSPRSGSKPGAILVTGGAGYIGSHVVAMLGERDERLVVLDNLSTGHASAVLHGQLVVGDTGDRVLLDRLMRKFRFETVFHFAASTVVPDSVARPLACYDNNTARARVLLEACNDHRVGQFIFSSTAAVYGDPPGGVASEATPPAPGNPYGRSKLMTEWMLKDLGMAGGPRSVILRYFNVAGCDTRGRIGQDTPRATHLIKVAAEHAAGTRQYMEIYGSDYETPDGTCIRDFIHVEDLAEAHLAALDYLRRGGESLTANCGYGHGYSVREVVERMSVVSGRRLDVRARPRRPGDMPRVIADARLARRVLGWHPVRDDLDLILGSALAWERRRLEGCTRTAEAVEVSGPPAVPEAGLEEIVP